MTIAYTDAAVPAKIYYPEIRAFYQKALRRFNHAIAHTVVANELARIAYHVLTNKEVFRSFKGQPLSSRRASCGAG